MIYELNYNLISIIDILALSQGIIIGLLLIFFSTKKRPSLLLGLFIISFTLEVLDVILEETGLVQQYPNLIFLPVNFYFLSIPLLYLYTKNLVREISLKESLIIISPGILEFVIVFILFLFPSVEKLRIVETNFIQTFTEIYDYSSTLFSIFFAILIIKLIKKHKIKIKDYYSNLKWKKLNWILYISYYILIQYIIILIFSFFPLHDDLFCLICSIINLIIIYWVGIYGLLQLKLQNSAEELDNESMKRKLDNTLPSIEKPEYDDAFAQLLVIIKDKKSYKEHDLTLSTLSKQSGISKRVLSQIINKNANTNFNMFINEFRVNEAKCLLSNTDFNHYSIQGIAFEAGFKSKATFYAVFKKMVGKTPNEYKVYCKK